MLLIVKVHVNEKLTNLLTKNNGFCQLRKIASVLSKDISLDALPTDVMC